MRRSDASTSAITSAQLRRLAREPVVSSRLGVRAPSCRRPRARGHRKGSHLDVDAHHRPSRRPLPAALGVAGASAEKVTLVVNYHLHFDHCGGNPLLTGCPIVAQRAELELARHAGSPSLSWSTLPDCATSNFKARPRSCRRDRGAYDRVTPEGISRAWYASATTHRGGGWPEPRYRQHLQRRRTRLAGGSRPSRRGRKECSRATLLFVTCAPPPP
jgi:hypothetical protein